jgi:hypothetical protein
MPPGNVPGRPGHPVADALLRIGRCEKGDKVVIVAGSRPGTSGRTSALGVHTTGGAAALGSGPGLTRAAALSRADASRTVPRVGFEPTLHGF